MECKRYMSLLDKGEVQNLSESELKAFHAHAQGCSSCKSHFEAQDEMNAMLVNYSSIDLKAPANLANNVLDIIGSKEEKPNSRILNYSYRLLAVASAFLLGLFVFEQFNYVNQIAELEQNYLTFNTEKSVQSFITEKKKDLKFSKTSKYIKESYHPEIKGMYVLKLK